MALGEQGWFLGLQLQPWASCNEGTEALFVRSPESVPAPAHQSLLSALGMRELTGLPGRRRITLQSSEGSKCIKTHKPRGPGTGRGHWAPTLLLARYPFELGGRGSPPHPSTPATDPGQCRQRPNLSQSLPLSSETEAQKGVGPVVVGP